MTKVLTEILNELKTIKGVVSVTLVSRSGMFIAGDFPENTHSEVYAAMSAIILGAAEATAIEAKLELSHASIDYITSHQYLFGCGTKAILVLFSSELIDIKEKKNQILDIIDKINENIG